MVRLAGIPREDLDAAGEKLATLAVEALHAVADAVSRRLGAHLTAAAAEPTPEPTPGPPGEPYVSPDDLAVIRTEWAAQVAGRLLPMAAELYQRGALALSVGLTEALPEGAAAGLPAVSNDLAEQYLAGASNRLRGIGDDLWTQAREQLLEGFQAGESIPALRDRVRSAAGLTEARATVIARTEVIGASNAGSYDQMAALGLPATKTWLATNDARTRESHRAVDGASVPLADPFEVGGALMLRPHDPAGPAAEVINCRCTLTWEIAEDAAFPATPSPALAAAAADAAGGAPTNDGGTPAMPWHIETDYPACDGYAVVKDDTGQIVEGGCHETKEEAQAQLEALYASEPEAAAEDQAAPAASDPQAGEHFHSVMIVEEISTGLRTFSEGALDWREPPFAFRWQVMEPETGGHALAVHVGNVTRVERHGRELHAWGPLDLRSADGLEFARKLAEGFAPWASIGLDESFRERDVEYVFPEDGEVEPQPDAPEGDPDGEILPGPEPEQMIVHKGKIAELTAVTVPAQAEAYIEALPALRDALVEAGVIAPEEAATALAAAGDVAPPASWFADPGLDEPTPITVDDDGRVRGHAALHGTCHVGVLGECVTPPAEDEYGHFMTGELVTASGERVAVGQITLGTGHAPLHLAARPAAEHYDHTGTAVADVSVGRDEHGIWVAGAIRPGVEPSRVAELRASGQVSGDWRRIGGRLRLVGLLAVNVPGFPVPKMRARVASGVPRALVAAGALPPSVAVVAALAAGDATRTLHGLADQIARAAERDRVFRRRALVARVRAGR